LYFDYETGGGKLGIKDIEDVLRASRMRWLGHVECSTGWIARVRERKILAQNAPGRPKLTWDELVKRDRVLLGMERIQACSNKFG